MSLLLTRVREAIYDLPMCISYNMAFFIGPYFMFFGQFLVVHNSKILVSTVAMFNFVFSVFGDDTTNRITSSIFYIFFIISGDRS